MTPRTDRAIERIVEFITDQELARRDIVPPGDARDIERDLREARDLSLAFYRAVCYRAACFASGGDRQIPDADERMWRTADEVRAFLDRMDEKDQP